MRQTYVTANYGRPWTNAQQHRLNVVTLTFLTTLAGGFVMFSLVLASGILPISFGALLFGGAGFGAAAIPAAVFGRSRIRFVLFAILAVVLTFFATTRLFLFFQQGGLEHAKRYGARWAAIIDDIHASTGQWPASLDAIARSAAPPSADLPWPYLSSCRAGVCHKFAGYFVAYLPQEAPPRLRIARRDIRVT